MRLLFETGQNSSGQIPQHFGIITGNSQIKVWATDNGQQIPINQSKFKLTVPKCLAITSTHRPPTADATSQAKSVNNGLLAVGTLNGVIFLISLTTGELVQTLHHTVPQAASATQTIGNRQLAVRDLLWSRDGSKLYSISQQYVFEWNVSINANSQQKASNVINTHKRFAPLAIFQDGGSLAGGFSTSQHHSYEPEETFQTLKLNYNQDKLIIGTNMSVYVFDMVSATIVAKYVGFLGKVTSLSINEPIHSIEQQQYHHLLQQTFLSINNNNDNTRQFTEFYIAIGTNADRNIIVYQYPPAPGTETTTVVLDVTKASTTQTVTKSLIVTSHEACICTVPDTTANIRLFTMYDAIPTHLSTDANKDTTSIQSDFICPTPIIARPSLLIGVATVQGQAQMYYLPAIAPMENGAKGTKNLRPEISSTLKTLRLASPQLTIHDPTITAHNNKELSAEAENVHKLSGKNLTTHAKNRSVQHDILPMYRNGAICDVIVLNMAQVCVVRQSTIRPQVEIVTLVPSQVKSKALNMINYDDLNNVTIKAGKDEKNTTMIQFTDKYNAVFKQWKALLTVAPLQSAANQSVMAVMKQDELLQIAVRSVKTKGTHILVNTGDATSISKITLTEDIMGDDAIDQQSSSSFVDRNKIQSLKRQKLLLHTAHLNITLQELLQEQQLELEKVSDVTRYNIQHPTRYDPITAATSDFDSSNTLADQFNALMSTLKGTLCAVLVQAIQSNDDKMVEHVIRMGVEGLSTNSGWTLLTQFLNNPQAMAKLDNTEADIDSAFQDSISTTGGNTVFDEKQLQRGKTLITTIKLLPTQYIVPFINVLTHKLHSNPLRSFELLPWIHVVLRLHSMYLLSLPDIGEKLYQISNILKQRCNTMNNIIQLKGRLEVILTQFNNNNQRNKQLGMNGDADPFLPLNVYVEHDDQVADDDIDMFSINKKRKHPSVDNFKLSGLELADIDDDDEEENEFDDDDMVFGDEEGGEGELFGEGDDFDDDEIDDFDEDMMSDDFDLDDDDC